MPKLVEAKYLSNYQIRVRFSDGAEGSIDLAPELWGPIFEPLKDLEYFQSFELDEELDTVVWPNGADFSPEYIYEQVTSANRSAG